MKGTSNSKVAVTQIDMTIVLGQGYLYQTKLKIKYTMVLKFRNYGPDFSFFEISIGEKKNMEIA